jgi:hypothetical protein
MAGIGCTIGPLHAGIRFFFFTWLVNGLGFFALAKCVRLTKLRSFSTITDGDARY